MELSITNITTFLAIVLTGLSAGLFYAWQVSVIPGTSKVSDANYLFTMQSINKEILNPAFFLIFFGCLIALAATSFLTYGTQSFWLAISATLVYLFGTFFVTSAGNVPLNNQLEVLNLGQISLTQISEFRAMYEPKWNRLHTVRTFFSVVSFILILMAANPFKG